MLHLFQKDSKMEVPPTITLRKIHTGKKGPQKRFLWSDSKQIVLSPEIDRDDFISLYPFTTK